MKNIIVVDSNPEISRMIKDTLSEEGLSVDTSCNAGDALKLLGGKRYDMVVANIGIPDMDIVKFYRKTTVMHPYLANNIIFIMAGESVQSDLLRFVEESGCIWLLSPFHATELINTVNLLMQH